MVNAVMWWCCVCEDTYQVPGTWYQVYDKPKNERGCPRGCDDQPRFDEILPERQTSRPIMILPDFCRTEIFASADIYLLVDPGRRRSLMR